MKACSEQEEVRTHRMDVLHASIAGKTLYFSAASASLDSCSKAMKHRSGCGR